MTVVRASDGSWSVERDGVVARSGFATSAEAWRWVDRQRGEPISPAEKRSQYAWDKACAEQPRNLGNLACDVSVVGAARLAPRDFQGWTWPDGLRPLRNWLAGKGVDVGSVKTARQALFFARRLGNVSGKMPKPGEELFPALLAVQRRLCPVGKSVERLDGKPRKSKPGRARPPRRSELVLRQVVDDVGPVLIKRADAVGKFAVASTVPRDAD